MEPALEGYVSTVVFVGLFYGVPGLVALLPAGGDWRIVLKAYGIWIALLVGCFLIMTGNLEEGLGWAAIFGMFISVFAVPVLSLILKRRSILKQRKQTGHGI
ncbi:MAG: hypothetical protein AAGC96_17550 [Pseudomonadota bacterium]